MEPESSAETTILHQVKGLREEESTLHREVLTTYRQLRNIVTRPLSLAQLAGTSFLPAGSSLLFRTVPTGLCGMLFAPGDKAGQPL